jgi:hypothetical protein
MKSLAILLFKTWRGRRLVEDIICSHILISEIGHDKLSSYSFVQELRGRERRLVENTICDISSCISIAEEMKYN